LLQWLSTNQMSDTLPWERIFLQPDANAPGTTQQMGLLRKNGKPFLLLPQNRRLAAAAMDLYAPQTKKARWMARIFQLASRIAPLAGIEHQSLRLRSDDPFLRFLGQVAGSTAPNFAMLAGNPNAAGQRNIFLVFNGGGKTAAIVKAGAGEAAARLIAHEKTFLQSAPANLPSIPKVRASFADERVTAFAMDFFPGSSPRAKDLLSAHKILTSWLNPEKAATICDLSVWKKLLSSAGASLSPMVRELGGKTVSTAIYHGDFAPWNIRAHGGTWTVLDWERGEAEGMPLWDLLHFVIQPAILVEHAAATQILFRLNVLMGEDIFRDYMGRSGLTEIRIPLLMAYLNYCLHVTRQTEGIESIKELIQLVDSSGSNPNISPGNLLSML
jgi:hypothetical protein